MSEPEKSRQELLERKFSPQISFSPVTTPQRNLWVFQGWGSKITTGILRVVRLAYASQGGF